MDTTLYEAIKQIIARFNRGNYLQVNQIKITKSGSISANFDAYLNNRQTNFENHDLPTLDFEEAAAVEDFLSL